MIDSSEKRGSEYPLLVDVPPPVLSAFWSTAGSVLLMLLVFSALFLPPAASWLIALAMVISVLAARLSRRVPVPRRHPATFWALLALLLPLPFALSAGWEISVFPALLMILAVAWSAVWLIRTDFAVRLSGWGLLTLGAVASLLSWRGFGEAGVLFPFPETALALVLLVVGYFPWLLTFRGSHKASAYALFAILLAGVFAPANLVSLSALVNRTPVIAWHDALVFVPLVLAAFLLFRSVLKERRRWRAGTFTRGMLLSMLPLAPLLPFIIAFQRGGLAGTNVTVCGALLGLSLAARERLIHEDATRHPRSTPGPWWAPLSEALIAARSLAAFLFRRDTAIADETTPGTRRILDPKSPKIVNPYRDGDPLWVPAVMHLHSNRWEGAFSPLEVISHYTRIGAGSIILTDHNRITRVPHPNAGPVSYEHGWGPHNHHVLVLGAKRTIPDSHPFGGTLSGRRLTLSQLRATSEFLVLAHPRSGKAWGREDLVTLEYDAVELFNKSADDTVPWDEALTSGQLVWGTAGDDCHDLRSRHQTGKRFLLLDLRGIPGIDEDIPPSPSMVLDALREGRFVAICLAEPPLRRRVTRHLPEPDAPRITSFTRRRDELEVSFAQPVEEARVIVDGSKVLHQTENTASVRLAVPEDHAYARLEVRHKDYILALNPLARVDPRADLPWPVE